MFFISRLILIEKKHSGDKIEFYKAMIQICKASYKCIRLMCMNNYDNQLFCFKFFDKYKYHVIWLMEFQLFLGRI